MKFTRLLSILALMLASAAAWAQNGTMTPYSRYGYGILNDNSSATQRAMGGVGYAMSSGRQSNVMNPASYAAIDSLTFLFDMGGNVNFISSSEGTVNESTISGGLDYITMAFPISKRIGASLGMLPFSSTGYQFSDTIGNGYTQRQGDGGISKLYIGAGINPFADLYVGFSFSYMFGSNINDLYVMTDGGSTSLFERYIKVHDWHLDLGVQYPIAIGDNKLTIGATYSPAKSLHGETYGIYYDASLDTKADTIGMTSLNGKYSLPATYGFGVNLTLRKLMVEADFTYQPWKDAKYATIESFESVEFANRWKAAVGMQYTPMQRGSYFKRTNYRFGAYYNHDYLMIRGNNVREYGVTAGVGLPVPGFKSTLNLGLEYKHRQAHPNPLIKENYFNIYVGINFNEMWFRKSKIY